MGRFFSCGSYILPEEADLYAWYRLRAYGCVAGFYYDGLGPLGIRRLRVVGDELSVSPLPRVPQYMACKAPMLAKSTNPWPSKLYLSVADLRDLRRVDICKVADRLSGMLIHYNKNPPVALGQWRTNKPTRHECIFDSNGPQLIVPSYIYFKTSKLREDQEFVTDVSFSPLIAEDGSYQAFSLQQVSSHANAKYCHLTEPIGHCMVVFRI